MNIIGIDEVGRGCWAGPLVAAAVEFAEDVEIVGLTDSKKLTAKRRAFLVHEIQAKAINIGVGWVFPKEINVLGLTETVRLAMQKAIDQINLNGQQVVIDGNYNYLPHIQNSTAVVKADGSLQEMNIWCSLLQFIRIMVLSGMSDMAQLNTGKRWRSTECYRYIVCTISQSDHC